MTQKAFNDLPLLLRAADVAAVLRCDKETLKILREANPELARKLPGMSQWRYSKSEVAKLARLVYE
jgi:hypothetical protein